MQYLKLVNCPVRGLFPETNDKIDWKGAGFDPVAITRFSVQGFDSVDGNYVSLFPIDDKGKLLDSGIIEKVNSNENTLDTAEILTAEQAEVIKVVILEVREA